MSDESLFQGAGVPLGETTDGLPRFITWMPYGRQVVHCTKNGQPVMASVDVQPDLVPRLQAQLADRIGSVRPFIGFDHKPGPAAGFPVEFIAGENGILLKVDWTQAGQEAIQGRNYSYFSPSWLQDPASPVPFGLPPSGEIGSLTNNPAFEKMDRLAAASPGETGPTNTTQNMNEDQLAELQSLRDQLAALTAERDALQQELTNLRSANAETVACAAVRDGRITEAAKPDWIEALVKEPVATAKLLGALPPRESAQIHRAAKAPADQAEDILATYTAMKPGPEKDAFLRENSKALLAASRKER